MVDPATPSKASASIYGRLTLQDGHDYFVTPSLRQRPWEGGQKKPASKGSGM